MTARRCSLLALVVGLVLAVLGVPSASAAGHTVPVKLTGSGPVPLSVTISVGDQLVFVNGDKLDHRVVATKGFKFDVTVAPGKTSAPTPVFTTVGTDTYRDSRLVSAGVSIGDMNGTVKVNPAPSSSAAPAPSGSAPRPTASGAAPTSSGAAHPQPSGAAPAASPGSSASPAAPGSAAGPGGTGGSGTATSPLLPGFLGGSLGTPAPAPGTGPAPNIAPNVAPPGPDGSVVGGAPGPGALASGPTGSGAASGAGSLAQRSPGRQYGLPAALAVVAIAGLLSLLVRLLLAEPAARRHRSNLIGGQPITDLG